MAEAKKEKKKPETATLEGNNKNKRKPRKRPIIVGNMTVIKKRNRGGKRAYLRKGQRDNAEGKIKTERKEEDRNQRNEKIEIKK